MAINIKKSTKRKIRRGCRIGIRLICSICTFVLIVVGSFNLIFNGGKMALMQFSMLHYNSTISEYETERDHQEEIANDTIYSVAVRSAAQKQADTLNAEIKRLSAERKELSNTNDKIVVFATKNGFSPLICIVLVLILGAESILIYMFIHFTETCKLEIRLLKKLWMFLTKYYHNFNKTDSTTAENVIKFPKRKIG